MGPWADVTGSSWTDFHLSRPSRKQQERVESANLPVGEFHMKRTPLNTAALLLASAMFALGMAGPAAAKNFKLKMQTNMGAGSPHEQLLQEFAQRVETMSDGSIKIEVLPRGAVVDWQEIPDAVNKGLVDMGQGWTHFYTGKHPAAGLFNSPLGGAGTGLDQMGHLAWMMYGGGKELNQRWWTEVIGLDIVDLQIIPDGPEALGWFKKPVTTMDEFRKLKFRTPPGLPGEAYTEMGVSVVSMMASELIPAMASGTVDAGEWINPATDLGIGFPDVAKYYSLQGLHQAIDISSIYINGKTWRAMSPGQRAIIETAAEATIARSMAFFIKANSEALETLVTKHGVILMNPPEGYPEEFLAAANKVLERRMSDPFFAEVMGSIQKFANTAVKYRAETLKQSLFMGEAGMGMKK